MSGFLSIKPSISAILFLLFFSSFVSQRSLDSDHHSLLPVLGCVSLGHLYVLGSFFKCIAG